MIWSLTDNLGTIRDLAEYNAGTDTTTVTNHRKFDSFGKITAETNAAVDHIFAFTGRELDEEIGLYNYRARLFDPSAGRFLSEDPLQFIAGDSNLSRYVGNGPLGRTDPSGLCSVHTLIMAEFTVLAYQTALLSLPFVAPYHHQSMPHQHCVWNCRMTRAMGPEFAAAHSFLKEQIDLALADLRDSLVAKGCMCLLPKFVRDWIEDSADSAWQLSDILDNAKGIEIGLAIADFDQNPFDDTLCEVGCTAADIGPNTPEGDQPGSTRPFGPRSKPHIVCTWDRKYTLFRPRTM